VKFSPEIGAVVPNPTNPPPSLRVRTSVPPEREFNTTAFPL